MNSIVSELVIVGDRIDDGDLAMTILCRVPDDWDVVVSSICNLPESEFSCATVKRRLIAEWQRRTESSSRTAEAMFARAAEGKPVEKKQPGRANAACFKFGKKGHFERDCALRTKKAKRRSKQAAGKSTNGDS
ncbi:hypothetical protein D918_10036 [Trichuris suis]|nr:hypothetical protein D918_10036 [Trichuris suis]